MKNAQLPIVFLFMLFLTINQLYSQNLTGIEVSLDQDSYADFIRDSMTVDKNYTVAMRIGIYGELADHVYLGLPWIRQKVDNFFIDNLLYNSGFRHESSSYNFVFTINGFSPNYISDETSEFTVARAAGYDLAEDRPFSSFTGFRSSRRLEGNKLFAHSAIQSDFAVTTSFTFGFAGLGLARGLDNGLGTNRPDANLWRNDDGKPYPNGQVMFRPMPLFMYSVSAEAVVWKPIRKVVLQMRPEINLGYYTNFGFGLDFGKVMNVERHVDNLGYTDTNNPSLVKVNNEFIGFSLVGGITARLVIYNAHLNGLYSGNDGHFYSFGDTRRLMLEAYVGAKLQLLKKVEISFSLNQRSSEFRGEVKRNPIWGTIGFKYLIAPEGEGCYE